MAQRVICVVGPTASGKTKMGVALAKRFSGEVVSVDSMQIYRGMAIGTAAPTPAEMEGVPHHMIGEADPLVRGNTFAAGQQGGAVRQELQERLAQEGAAALLAELAAVDPETAARLHLRDEKRILRALEVYRETGETISEHDRKSRETPDRYDALYIGLSFRDRQDLRDRIDRRVDAMVAQGLLAEVRRLLGSGLPRDATALQAIGFKQFLAVADGTATEAEAVEEVKLRSRQYAKRQLTWLRRNPDIHWILWEKEPDFPWALQNATDFLTAAGVC